MKPKVAGAAAGVVANTKRVPLPDRETVMELLGISKRQYSKRYGKGGNRDLRADLEGAGWEPFKK